MNFETLLTRLTDIHTVCEYEGAKAVNKAMTLRNWLFGAYLVEYEQREEDRAVYGARLLERVAEKFSNLCDIRMSATTLRVCRQFYHTYPAMYQTVSDVFTTPMLGEIHQAVSDESEIAISPSILLENISFSHFVELVKIDDSLKRTFYEVETIRGTWGVRELKRQISTLYFERTGMSTDIQTLISRVDGKAEPLTSRELLKNPFTFEFLGLPMEGAVEESRLENAGQLNSYVTYYNKNIKTDTDNPAIGLLLCTGGNEELIEYATASMDENLFVRQYLVNLPDKEKLRGIIRKTKSQFKGYEGNDE